jgi:hypothetical protein
MKVKTRDLTDAALDWAVAVCEDRKIVHDPMSFGDHTSEGGYWIWEDHGVANPKTIYAKIGRQYSPSTIWAQGGPIIDREITKVFRNVGGTFTAQIRHEESHPRVSHKVLAGWTNCSGPTALTAAMRCYVASEMGDEIDVPDALL